MTWRSVLVGILVGIASLSVAIMFPPALAASTMITHRSVHVDLGRWPHVVEVDKADDGRYLLTFDDGTTAWFPSLNEAIDTCQNYDVDACTAVAVQNDRELTELATWGRFR